VDGRGSKSAAAVVVVALIVGCAFVPSVGRARRAAASGSVRTVTDLATGWRFHAGNVAGAANPSFDDSTWDHVTLPHTWNAFDGEDGSGTDKPAYLRTVSWYRTKVAVPATTGPDGLPLSWYLQFDGAALDTIAYVNGVEVGHHEGGYTAFRFDITPDVTPGSNATIAVSVDNRSSLPIIPKVGDFTIFGGLYRMVHLVGVDAVHVTLLDHGGPGVVLRPTVGAGGDGSLDAQTVVDNARGSDAPITVETDVVDGNGTTVASTSSTTTVSSGQSASVDETVSVPSVHLWDGVNDPYLYQAKIVVSDASGVLDEVDQNIGFRTFVVDANTGAWLNGHPYQLRGVNLHESWQDQGSALSNADIDSDIASVLALGANAMRFAHYPHNQRYVDNADAAGLAVWDEIPLVWTTYSTDPTFTPNVEQQLTEMISQNENHPSVFVWGLGDELKTVKGTDPTVLLSDLQTLAHNLDPTRMTTQAMCLGNKCPSLTSPVYSATDITGVNVFTGWFSKPLSSLPAQLDQLHASLPGRPLGMSEFGAGSSQDFHTDQPVPLQYTDEYAVTFHEAYLKAVAARPWLWCAFMWNLAGQASDSRNEGDAAGRGDGGLLSFDRKVKNDDYSVYQAWWSPNPVVRLESSTWTDRTNASATITAISNGVSVEAFLNGASLGVIQADGKHLFSWPVTLSPGANTISVVATLADSSTISDGAVWTLRTTPLTSALIDAGSSTPTIDSQSRTWSADTDFTGGVAAQYGGPVSGTPDPAIAATYRIGQSYYDIPLDNGNYEVTIRLLEPKWTKAKKRLFSISSQGANQVFGLDLGKLVGAGTEYDVSFPATVATHALALAFQASKDQAVVSGIEVEPGP
jgi:beta-galactosidase